jgi:hypothetical protein
MEDIVYLCIYYTSQLVAWHSFYPPYYFARRCCPDLSHYPHWILEYLCWHNTNRGCTNLHRKRHKSSTVLNSFDTSQTPLPHGPVFLPSHPYNEHEQHSSSRSLLIMSNSRLAIEPSLYSGRDYPAWQTPIRNRRILRMCWWFGIRRRWCWGGRMRGNRRSSAATPPLRSFVFGAQHNNLSPSVHSTITIRYGSPQVSLPSLSAWWSTPRFFPSYSSSRGTQRCPPHLAARTSSWLSQLSQKPLYPSQTQGIL